MKFVGTLLNQHLQRYPMMELADIYKLLHQAALGGAHAVSDPAQARERLLQEVAAMGTGPDEPLLDPISPDGKLARVHLRAYVKEGGDVARLAEIFTQTAQQWTPNPEKLERFCACLGDFAAQGAIPFDAARVRAYFAQISEADFPAVHHSHAYRLAYRPAYRLVNRELLDFSA